MKKHPLEGNTNRSLVKMRDDGYYEPRIYHKKAHDKKGPRYLIKCGCCEEKIEIYYSDEDLEIGGVLTSIEAWRDLLLPLLKVDKPSQRRHPR